MYVVEENPTYGQYYGVDVAPGSTYEATRKAVMNATGWSFEEEFQWAETDENGNLIPGTDTEERLLAWLNSHLDDDYNLLETWGAREASQYAPGFELMRCLPLAPQWEPARFCRPLRARARLGVGTATEGESGNCTSGAPARSRKARWRRPAGSRSRVS
jgi:hypothetical protein